jgi:hypothetical protein
MFIFQECPINEIVMSEECMNDLLNHCLRKLNGQYLPEESPEPKAYGLIGGKVVGQALSVELVAPLYKNSRSEGVIKEYMDTVFDEYAIASETPLAKRGWATDPMETKNILKICCERDLQLVGTYHMHRVSWKGDEMREKPTELDTVLAKDAELFMFIVSVIDPKKPVVRAFFEGSVDNELPIKVKNI